METKTQTNATVQAPVTALDTTAALLNACENKAVASYKEDMAKCMKVVSNLSEAQISACTVFSQGIKGLYDSTDVSLNGFITARKAKDGVAAKLDEIVVLAQAVFLKELGREAKLNAAAALAGKTTEVFLATAKAREMQKINSTSDNPAYDAYRKHVANVSNRISVKAEFNTSFTLAVDSNPESEFGFMLKEVATKLPKVKAPKQEGGDTGKEEKESNGITATAGSNALAGGADVATSGGEVSPVGSVLDSIKALTEPEQVELFQHVGESKALQDVLFTGLAISLNRACLELLGEIRTQQNELDRLNKDKKTNKAPISKMQKSLKALNVELAKERNNALHMIERETDHVLEAVHTHH